MTNKEALNRIALRAQTVFGKDEAAYEYHRKQATELIKAWAGSTVRYRNKNYGVIIHEANVETIRDKKIFINFKCSITREGRVALENGEFNVSIVPGWLFTNHVRVFGVSETAEGMKVRDALQQAFLNWYGDGEAAFSVE